MKKIAFAALLASSAVASFAQSEGPLTFDNDILIQIPKYSVSFGTRGLSGAKSSFSGTGSLATIQDYGPLTGTDVNRIYHDGAVNKDTRQVDGQPISPDGKTNSWNFLNNSQVVDGNIAMHAYRADVVDTGPRSKDPSTAYGMEVAVARDMGRVIRFDWNLGAGLSLNDINSEMKSNVRANITKVTDTYSLFGATPPEAPYTAPSQTQPPANEDGSIPLPIDTTVLLGNEPLSRETTTSTDETSVNNRWKLKGAYFTLRAGPTISIPVTSRFRATVSAGAALIYAGTNYSITQTYQPETGPEITQTDSEYDSALLPGFYADANVEFWLTERAGVYLGAVYQGAGDYTQSVKTETSDYSTTVDLSSLQGFRAGVNIKF